MKHQCNDQHPPNPDKKGNKDPKGKESKLPQAKTKKKRKSPTSSSSQLSKKKNETMWLEKIPNWTTWQNEKKDTKTLTKYM